MPLVLSILDRPAEDVLRNHAHYCGLYGYAHQAADASRLANDVLRDAFRYAQIFKHLRSLAEGDWLLFLDGDSVVYTPIAVEALMENRDSLLLEGLPSENVPAHVMTNMFVLRNTAANRTLLLQLLDDTSRVIALEIETLDESARLRALPVLPCNAILANAHVNASWRNPSWNHAPIFVLCLAALPAVHRSGRPLVGGLHSADLQSFLVREVNAALMYGTPPLKPPNWPALSEEALSSSNASARVALVTLYTPNIASYARISERNVRRYCDRHGYAYHVYRAIPKDLGAGIKGNWAKPWVLQQHFAQHEWILWIDADMLFVDQAQPLDPFLEGRELLLAKDIGAWRINSGLMGFRNTPGNAEVLARLWERISQVDDKSGIYSSMGDQYYVNQVLHEMGLDGQESVVDHSLLNTPHYLREESTLLMHFLGLAEPYRSAYMAEVDRQSLQNK